MKYGMLGGDLECWEEIWNVEKSLALDYLPSAKISVINVGK
jgi:hypothetical protein